MNFTLRSAHHPELVWHPTKKIVYMQAPPDRSSRKIKGRYRGSRGRAFFTPYFGKDDTTKISFCRHYAASLYFRRWSEQWFLEINPTYHFTIDGRRDSLYDAEYVQKIKRLERNNAVYQPSAGPTGPDRDVKQAVDGGACATTSQPRRLP